MREQVKEFFEESNKYLSGNSTIHVRKIIIDELIGDRMFESVLDLGCGDGSLSTSFVGKCKELTLVDFSSEMINIARSRIQEDENKTKITFINSSIEEFKEEKKVDLILLFGVLAHVENLDEVLDKCVNLLKEGGSILLQNSNSKNVVTKFNYWISDIKKTRKYKVNRLSDAYIENAFRSRHMILVNKRHYLSNTFGLRRVSKNVDFKLKKSLAKTGPLRTILPEIIYEFKKQSKIEDLNDHQRMAN